MNKLWPLTLSAALLAGLPAFAADHGKGHKMNMSADKMHQTHKMDKMPDRKVMVEHPWARASVSRNGAAYFTISNRGKAEVNVVSATTDVAKRAELHTHIMDGDIMRMRHVDKIAVPAGSSVSLKPGGHHVMLMGLTRKLKEGETFPMTVTFADGTKTQVVVKVGKIGAAGPMDHMKHMGNHGGHKIKH